MIDDAAQTPETVRVEDEWLTRFETAVDAYDAAQVESGDDPCDDAQRAYDEAMEGLANDAATLLRRAVRVLLPEDVPGPTFPLARRFTVGERCVSPGHSGSYPDRSRNRWGYVVDIKPRIVTETRETLVVQFDGDEPRGINPDVIAHGDDWRYAKDDPSYPPVLHATEADQ